MDELSSESPSLNGFDGSPLAGQKEQLQGDSDPPAIEDRQIEDFDGGLEPTSEKEEVKSNLLPSALKLLPSRAKPDHKLDGAIAFQKVLETVNVLLTNTNNS